MFWRLVGKDTLPKRLRAAGPQPRRGNLSVVSLVIALRMERPTNTFEQGNLEKNRACILAGCYGEVVSKSGK